MRSERICFYNISIDLLGRGVQIPLTLWIWCYHTEVIFKILNISPLRLSDHSVLSLSCPLHVDNVSTSNKFRWDMMDYSTLQKFLHKNWDNILDHSHSSVDTMWEQGRIQGVSRVSGHPSF